MFTVIETATFRRTASAFWSDDDIAEFVDHVSEHADAGDVIAGTKGLRKLRWSRPGMGKRGAARVIYFVRNALGEVVLLVAYAKASTDNLPTAFLNRLKEQFDA